MSLRPFQHFSECDSGHSTRSGSCHFLSHTLTFGVHGSLPLAITGSGKEDSSVYHCSRAQWKAWLGKYNNYHSCIRDDNCNLILCNLMWHLNPKKVAGRSCLTQWCPNSIAHVQKWPTVCILGHPNNCLFTVVFKLNSLGFLQHNTGPLITVGREPSFANFITGGERYESHLLFLQPLCT